mgnify:CR=1 FL=1
MGFGDVDKTPGEEEFSPWSASISAPGESQALPINAGGSGRQGKNPIRLDSKGKEAAK